MIVAISVLAVIGVTALLLAVFLPGLFGPKNLGVKPSLEAYESALLKLNGTKADKMLRKVDTSLTSEELTSFLRYDKSANAAMKRVQIRVNADNTVEFSAAVDKEYFVINSKNSKQDVSKSLPLINVLPGSVNVYAQLSGEVSDNKSEDLAFCDIEVMGVGLPPSLYNTTAAKKAVSNSLDSFLGNAKAKTKSSFQSIKAEDGELQIVGTVPASQK